MKLKVSVFRKQRHRFTLQVRQEPGLCEPPSPRTSFFKRSCWGGDGVRMRQQERLDGDFSAQGTKSSMAPYSHCLRWREGSRQPKQATEGLNGQGSTS